MIRDPAFFSEAKLSRAFQVRRRRLELDLDTLHCHLAKRQTGWRRLLPQVPWSVANEPKLERRLVELQAELERIRHAEHALRYQRDVYDAARYLVERRARWLRLVPGRRQPR